MGGRGRKPANRKGGGRTTPPAAKRGATAGGSRRAATPPRKPSRPQSYPFRDSHSRKRRQKAVVWVGVGVIVAAGIATIILGQLGGHSTPPQPAASSSSLAAPSSGAAATTTAAAGTTTVAAAPTGPVMVMSCPSGGGASPVFAHQIAKAAAPYSITITYGDGDTYTDTDQHLGAVFSHTYKAKGTYTVDAVLTDAAKQTASASCTYTW